MTPYAELLNRKRWKVAAVGREPGPIHSRLFPFQRDLVRWAIRKGRAAVFADTGLGKTLIQLEWAKQTGADRVLLFAPLAVGRQTLVEGEKLGVAAREVSQPENDPGIQIVNYQKADRFVGAEYGAVVLDESSILKSVDGKTRTLLLREFTRIPYRLCCTATPAPNDIAELANHAEFLGVARRQEMLAAFFVHDEDGWRLKGHASRAFWRWVAGWAAFVRKPSDIGHSDDGFALPPLRISEMLVDSDWRPDSDLFPDGTGHGIRGHLEARRATISERVRALVVAIRQTDNDQQWLVWCGLNGEGRELRKELGELCVLIEGSDSDEQKIERESVWRSGAVQTLITKPSMFGFGMNWQHCSRVAFLGLGYSYEQYYQAIRRCWRFGQAREVQALIVTTRADSGVVDLVWRKEAEAKRLVDGVVDSIRSDQIAEVINMGAVEESYVTDDRSGEGWRMRMGDCVERIREIAEGAIGLSVFSPPFAALYTYSDSIRDLGNSRDYSEFFDQFRYLIPELLRVTMPGRRLACHVQQVAITQAMNGVGGWLDFRGELVREFTAGGWVYDGEIVIDKDPQAQAIRTKAKALMFVQKSRDAAWLRPAMADYILCFRAPGENPAPVVPDVSNEEWICWARPIWYGIRESDTLSSREAREHDDDRHICPLQLETIERCVRLWTNEGETVLDPFAGIGSTGYVALRKGRKFSGIELKQSYYAQACRNLEGALRQMSLEFIGDRLGEADRNDDDSLREMR